MNKNFKVITINGIRGIFAAIFIIMGLIAGFIISPGWLCMNIWNYIMEQTGRLITMNLFQGILLWSIIALSLYAINNRKPLIGFGSYPALSPEQIKDIMKRAKLSEEPKLKDIDFLNKDLLNKDILNKDLLNKEIISPEKNREEDTSAQDKKSEEEELRSRL